MNAAYRLARLAVLALLALFALVFGIENAQVLHSTLALTLGGYKMMPIAWWLWALLFFILGISVGLLIMSQLLWRRQRQLRRLQRQMNPSLPVTPTASKT